jgi:hypothetical protein
MTCLDHQKNPFMVVLPEMHTWLRSYPETFFAYGIRRLVNSYTIAFEKKG